MSIAEADRWNFAHRMARFHFTAGHGLAFLIAISVSAVAGELSAGGGAGPGFSVILPPGLHADWAPQQNRPPWTEYSSNDTINHPLYKLSLKSSDTDIVREANSNLQDFSFPRRNWEEDRVRI